MNLAITDGVALMPQPFGAGLALWTTGDGAPGKVSLEDDQDARLVKGDVDFGTCLELRKDTAIKRLRAIMETPILPGRYLQISARVKAVAGPLPQVRIGGWAGKPGGGPAKVGISFGPTVALTRNDQVTEVLAIVGTGQRIGVDLVWPMAAYGHFGLDLTGECGGALRIADLRIVDITSTFQSDLLAAIDVRDYGAMGDGEADDTSAFAAADAAADGRAILVPHGVFRLADDLVLTHRLHCLGQVTQPDDKRLVLKRGFGFESYLTAFGDPRTAFLKAFQALVSMDDQVSLDLGGRIIDLDAPLVLPPLGSATKKTMGGCRIHNGAFRAVPGQGWSTPDHARNASPRDAYVLDLSQLGRVRGCLLDRITVQCGGVANGVLLPDGGQEDAMRACEVLDSKDHAIGRPGPARD